MTTTIMGSGALRPRGFRYVVCSHHYENSANINSYHYYHRLPPAAHRPSPTNTNTHNGGGGSSGNCTCAHGGMAAWRHHNTSHHHANPTASHPSPIAHCPTATAHSAMADAKRHRHPQSQRLRPY